MSDIKIFRLAGKGVNEIEGTSADIEKSLQTLIESHLETFFGIRFLASEYATGKVHGGRIDSLGIDENGCPVIVEYKRTVNENVINQGLFYLDWLMDHKAEFKLMVLEKVGSEAAAAISWTNPRLLCIAGDFTKYDTHAVGQMDRDIELIRYRLYGMDLILFELVNAVSSDKTVTITSDKKKKGKITYKTVSEFLEQSDESLKDLFETVKHYILSLGDDVQLKTMLFYFAFKRIKNFACVELHPTAKKLVVFVKVDPDSIDLANNKSFLRDVRKIGHFGTGDLEITISSKNDFEKAKSLFFKSYELS
jgi:predicted transport protein